MTFVRPARRVLITAASLSALVVAAACGGGGGGTAPGGGTSSGADFSKHGPIELWQGKDTAGDAHEIVAAWNAKHPNEIVTLHELPDDASQQRQQMIQNAQIKNAKMSVVSVDVVWTAEFAANGYIIPLPADQFPTEGVLKPVVDSATYFNKLYAFPTSSDGGLLYYRTDLLDKYSLKPPTTWDEMKQACQKIKAGENDPKLECYAGQFQKYEGLTVNFAEAVDSSGGSIMSADGKPTVNTPEATKGLTALVDMFKDGTIPKGAITWKEEEGRTAFQNGNLIFLRNWPYVYLKASATDGSSKVAGKFAVAPLPGLTGPGVSSLGGHNWGITPFGDNKGTAADFIKFRGSEEGQRIGSLKGSLAPVSESLYSDPEITKKYPYIPTLLKSVQNAKPRPKAAKYGDVSLAIDDAAYSALQGQTAPDAALATLQTKLESLTK